MHHKTKKFKKNNKKTRKMLKKGKKTQKINEVTTK